MMKTSRPRTFSSILTKISPSANRRIDTAHSGCPKCWAISSASGRLAVPARSSNWLRDNDKSRIGPRKVVGKPRVAKGLGYSFSQLATREPGRMFGRGATPSGSEEGAVTQLQERLTRAVATRYDVKSELGRGGMSVVFLAWDRKHECDVALKVLRPDLAAALGPGRFLQEIRTAARLKHPYILKLHDSGS